MTDLHYGGRYLDFWFLADKETGEPLHEVCGFSLISRITGKHRTLATSNTYIQQLKMFFEELVFWNNRDWRDITDEDIETYLYVHCFKKKGLAGSSILLQLTVIKEFYNWAYRFGLIEHPKEIDIGFEHPDLLHAMIYGRKEKLIQSQYIGKEDFKNLLAGIDRTSRFLAIRDELALLLGYECGTRTSELTNPVNFNVKQLKRLIQQCDAENRTTFDLAIYGKGGNKQRTLLITSRVFIKLKLYLSDRKLRGKFTEELPLFLTETGKPIQSPDYGSSVFHSAKLSAFSSGDWDNKRYHSLRHSFATNLASWCYEENRPWQSIIPPRMGHNHWRTSLIYVEIDALMNNRIDLLDKLKSKGQFERYVRGN